MATNSSPPSSLRSDKPFATHKLELVLTGHSGGGSLTFGYLNAITNIPADVKRIAFLDSNYAYETTNHFTKLANWLKQTDGLETPLSTNQPTPNPSKEGDAFANAPLNAPLLGGVGGGSAHDNDSPLTRPIGHPLPIRWGE